MKDRIKSIPITGMLKISTSQARDIKSGCNVTFEDGETVYLTPGELMFTRLIYNLLVISDLAYTSEYCVKNHYTDGVLTMGTFPKLVKIIFSRTMGFGCRYRYDQVFVDLFKSEVRTIVDELHSASIDKQTYAASVSLFDYIDIQSDSDLLHSMAEVKRQQSTMSVKKAYEAVTRSMRNANDAGNSVAKAYSGGYEKARTIYQLLGPRGFASGLDGRVYNLPIPSSLFIGHRSIPCKQIEARSASKAERTKKNNVAPSEYFSRLLQLALSTMRLVRCDCGNRSTVPITIREGTLGLKDLEIVAGTHYFEGGVERVVDIDDKHLLGKTINVRSLRHCKLRNKQEVCLECYGEVGTGYDVYTDLSQLSATNISENITTGSLSTKHHTGSITKTLGFNLTGTSAQYFTTSVATTELESARDELQTDTLLGINPKLFTNSNITISIRPSDCPGLCDIGNDNIELYNQARVSRIYLLHITVRSKDGTNSTFVYDIFNSTKKRTGILRVDFIRYMVNQGLTLGDDGMYHVSMDKWNKHHPFLTIERKDTSKVQAASLIMSKFKTSSTYKGELQDPYEFMMQLYDLLIDADIIIPLTMIQILVYNFTAAAPLEGDYSLVRGDSPTAGIVTISKKTHNGSCSRYLVQERSAKTDESPGSLYRLNVDDNTAYDGPLFPDIYLNSENVDAMYDALQQIKKSRDAVAELRKKKLGYYN